MEASNGGDGHRASIRCALALDIKALYISLVIIYIIYTGLCESDFNVYV